MAQEADGAAAQAGKANRHKLPSSVATKKALGEKRFVMVGVLHA
jgi:hypothetical protein